MRHLPIRVVHHGRHSVVVHGHVHVGDLVHVRVLASAIMGHEGGLKVLLLFLLGSLFGLMLLVVDVVVRMHAAGAQLGCLYTEGVLACGDVIILGHDCGSQDLIRYIEMLTFQKTVKLLSQKSIF